MFGLTAGSWANAVVVASDRMRQKVVRVMNGTRLYNTKPSARSELLRFHHIDHASEPFWW